jgi:hypothetical protein
MSPFNRPGPPAGETKAWSAQVRPRLGNERDGVIKKNSRMAARIPEHLEKARCRSGGSTKRFGAFTKHPRARYWWSGFFDWHMPNRSAYEVRQ